MEAHLSAVGEVQDNSRCEGLVHKESNRRVMGAWNLDVQTNFIVPSCSTAKSATKWGNQMGRVQKILFGGGESFGD